MNHAARDLASNCVRGDGRQSLASRDQRTAYPSEHDARCPLTWSDALSAQSRERANTLLTRNQFIHRPHSPYGKNLYEISGRTASATDVVERWSSESRNYDYSSNRCRGVCGHYTQIVWRSTKAIGCGVARGGGREIWVCNYDPPGNVLGHRPY